MAETLEEAKARLKKRAKVAFKGKKIITADDVSYFRPLKVPRNISVGNLLNNEVININESNRTLTVDGYFINSFFNAHNKYKLNYRVWGTTNDRYLQDNQERHPYVGGNKQDNIADQEHVEITIPVKSGGIFKACEKFSINENDFNIKYLALKSRDVDALTNTSKGEENFVFAGMPSDITLPRQPFYYNKTEKVYVSSFQPPNIMVSCLDAYNSIFTFKYTYTLSFHDDVDIYKYYNDLINGVGWYSKNLATEGSDEWVEASRTLTGALGAKCLATVYNNDTKVYEYDLGINNNKLPAIFTNYDGYYQRYLLDRYAYWDFSDKSIYIDRNGYTNLYKLIRDSTNGEYNRITLGVNYNSDNCDFAPESWSKEIYNPPYGWNLKLLGTNCLYNGLRYTAFSVATYGSVKNNQAIYWGIDTSNYFPYSRPDSVDDPSNLLNPDRLHEFDARGKRIERPRESIGDSKELFIKELAYRYWTVKSTNKEYKALPVLLYDIAKELQFRDNNSKDVWAGFISVMRDLVLDEMYAVISLPEVDNTDRINVITDPNRGYNHLMLFNDFTTLNTIGKDSAKQRYVDGWFDISNEDKYRLLNNLNDHEKDNYLRIIIPYVLSAYEIKININHNSNGFDESITIYQLNSDEIGIGIGSTGKRYKVNFEMLGDLDGVPVQVSDDTLDYDMYSGTLYNNNNLYFTKQLMLVLENAFNVAHNYRNNVNLIKTVVFALLSTPIQHNSSSYLSLSDIIKHISPTFNNILNNPGDTVDVAVDIRFGHNTSELRPFNISSESMTINKELIDSNRQGHPRAYLPDVRAFVGYYIID